MNFFDVLIIEGCKFIRYVIVLMLLICMVKGRVCKGFE